MTFARLIKKLFAISATLLTAAVFATLLAGLFIVFMPYIFTPAPAPVTYPEDFGKLTLVIDPGHGGENEGAKTFWGLCEKRRNLRVAWALKKRLEKTGHWDVYLTRDREMYLTNSMRPVVANEHDADIYISIHGNAWGTKRQGYSVIWYAAQKQPQSIKLAQFMAEAMRDAGFPMDMKMGPRFEDFHKDPERSPDYQLWSDDLPIYVREKTNHPMIYPAKMPAVLIETHYMSNPTQALQFESSLVIDRLITALERGLVNFALIGDIHPVHRSFENISP